MRRRAITGVDKDLGDQVVVLRRDASPGLDCGVDADAGPARHDPRGSPAPVPARSRGPGSSRQANLDGLAVRGRPGPLRGGQGGSGQGPARREAELLPDDVETGTSSVTPCSTWSRVLTSRK